ncbi:MAG: TauD/TfdA family dioxygenase [Rhodospirillaceae bacterium]|nr:TauD/TfdA family dioxygenase [Rhodospirillaceae bacterium]MBT5191864.1 TauD/TfdA family dioxygenase [Rhodospirillaceae bacterium]MBT5897360.1 TauD/TfdA family dioxygenase [Rhodospirillaceae bacterium]MBT6430846.1 TauD/TfdA family dioxygenase [Rhodospirillaceae bacterium]MBT7755797.1 TauD/TfdA family dioxygenase [Rhodospirillaceae bacterium]
MAVLNIEPIHQDFGARITGIDMRAPISGEAVVEIKAAIDDYSFVLFPNQPFDDDRQMAFTKLLGEPEESHVALGETGTVTYFGTIGNVQQDGSKLGNDHRKTKFLTGNNMWHSDSSFRAVPARLSIMCAYEVPETGGATEFVSLRAAHGRLDEETQDRIDPLVAIHDYVFSRSKVAPDAVSPSLAASLPPVPQKLVRSNPATGAKNYYLGSHARTIQGWDDAPARALLDDLQDRATQPEHAYAHAWQPEDLVIWDNRCLLHRGAGYDADRNRRYMRQTRVKGDGPTMGE